MKSSRFRRLTLMISLALFVLFNSSLAQHFVKMSDKQWVELALDMIRKGVQQQDTTKVFMVVAQEVWVKGEKVESKATLSRKLQTIFDNSHKRKTQLQKPDFPRADNPLHLSNFWDFDILDPKIKIEGDSAVVDCELVLWGAPYVKGSDWTSRRTKERFVFITPPEVEMPPPSGDRFDKLTTSYHKWPAPPSGKKRISSRRNWKLVGFEKLLDFLNGGIEQTEHSRGEDTYMKKK